MWIETHLVFSDGERDKKYHHLVYEDNYEHWKNMYIHKMDVNHGWSFHYRGVKFKKIDRPPQEWLKEEITKVDSKIQSLNTYLEILQGTYL